MDDYFEEREEAKISIIGTGGRHVDQKWDIPGIIIIARLKSFIRASPITHTRIASTDNPQIRSNSTQFHPAIPRPRGEYSPRNRSFPVAGRPVGRADAT